MANSAITFAAASLADSITVGGNATAAGLINLLEDSDNGSNKITITAPQSIASDKTVTLQDVTGTVYVTGGTDVSVADGGTGLSSATEYAVLCGGTTTTGAFQSIASVGTSGQVLTSNGAGALPTFQTASGGAWVKISSATASSSATISFTGLSSTYKAYKVILDHVAPATDDVSLLVRTSTNNGSSYDSGASDYRVYSEETQDNGTASFVTSAGTTSLTLNAAGAGAGLGNAANETSSGEFMIIGHSGASYAHAKWSMVAINTVSRSMCVMGSGIRVTAADVDAIQFLMSSGNIASGVFTLYGLTA